MKNLLEINAPNSPIATGLRASMALGTEYTAFASTTAQGAVATTFRVPEEQYLKRSAGLNDELYNSRAQFKIAAATYAMHLERNWRDVLFKQIDQLLDEEEWDARDKPITRGSSLTFFRLLLFLRPDRRPSLGATDDGNLVAAWVAGKNRLTLVCKPGDHIRWVLSTVSDDVPETAAGSTTTSRIPDVLAPYNKEQWFANANS